MIQAVTCNWNPINFFFYIFISIQILILITNKKNYIMKKLGKKREFEKMTVNAYCTTLCACSCSCTDACASQCHCYAIPYSDADFQSTRAATYAQAFGSIANNSGGGMAAALNESVTKHPTSF
jgi:putative bacteriocin precursor